MINLKSTDLKFKIISISISIYFISFVLLTLLALNITKEQMKKQITEDGIVLAKQIGKHIEYSNSYEKRIDDLLTDKIKAVAYLISKNHNIDDAYLIEVAKIADVSEINLISKEKKVTNSNLERNVGYSIPKEHPINSAFTKNEKEIIEEIRQSTTDNNFYKYGAISLEDGSIIQVGIQVDDINKLKVSLTKQDVVETLGKEENVVYALIIDKNLKAIAHSDITRIGINLTDKGSYEAAINGKIYSDKYFYEKENVKVQDVLIPLYENGEHLGAINVGLSLENLNIALKNTIIKAIVIAVIFFIIGGAILILLLRKVFRPLEDLVSISKLICDGDLNQRIVYENQDEVGVLSYSFNCMMDTIESKINENNKLMEEVLQYDKLKTEFFANISHELRTPINVIFSALQLMEIDIQQNTQHNNSMFIKYKDTIKQNIYRLIRLVNNLIDITKIDSGFFEVNLQNHNIVSVVEDITLSVAQYIENKSIELTFDTEIEERITGCDPYAFERIMLNLLSNAVKFTPAGGKIEVNLFDKKDRILITVSDTGQGIPEEKLEVIFDRFRQATDFNTRNHEGSGIGLALVKELVKLHGGSISVKSKYGLGTTFIIEIPIKIIEDSSPIELLNTIGENHIEKINMEFSDIYMFN
ncbi:signal transduction histidine kinase [Clostridium punense]|uniref:histidine kinase n=1 Tax=Clostridium punense TaxID=1054297 RepID=A0ABS4JZG0_9CLOT|nr:signal transduction histidine kinase [Clostridium punense]